MKFWKQGLAAALTVAMLLTLLTACAPSGPVTPEQPGSNTGTTEPSKPDKDPGTGETGGAGGATKDPTEKPGAGETDKDPTEKPGTSESDKDPTEDENDKKAEEQKAIEATVKALNAVRAEYGGKPLILNKQACDIAKQMAQVQLDGMTGKYKEQGEGSEYSKECTRLRGQKVQDKASIGFGAVYNGYPTNTTYRKWANSTNPVSAERNKALIHSKDATLVGVGVVQNPDTTSEYKYMVVVMTY